MKSCFLYLPPHLPYPQKDPEYAPSVHVSYSVACMPGRDVYTNIIIVCLLNVYTDGHSTMKILNTSMHPYCVAKWL